MTAILIYTRNFAIRKAIRSLVAQERLVFIFDNRLAFLVCATVMNKPYILIDTVHERGDNIRWIYSRLVARGMSNLIHFIIPENIIDNSFIKGFGSVTTIDKLKNFCNRAARLPEEKRSCALVSTLHYSLKEKLSKDHLEFLIKIYDPIKQSYICKNRVDINKLYYLRSRLSLGNNLELKQLIMMLASYNSGLQTDQENIK